MFQKEIKILIDKLLLFIKSIFIFLLNKSTNEPLPSFQFIIPKSVNYHFTRRCNYECGFCFHTAKTSYMMNLDDAKRGLKMLRLAGN